MFSGDNCCAPGGMHRTGFDKIGISRSSTYAFNIVMYLYVVTCNAFSNSQCSFHSSIINFTEKKLSNVGVHKSHHSKKTL